MKSLSWGCLYSINLFLWVEVSYSISTETSVDPSSDEEALWERERLQVVQSIRWSATLVSSLINSLRWIDIVEGVGVDRGMASGPRVRCPTTLREIDSGVSRCLVLLLDLG